MRWARCLNCNKRYPYEEVEERVRGGENLPRCECGGVLKPDVVFFGEAIPIEALMRSQEEARNCDLMLVVGTSGVVYPASELPLIAKRAERFRPGFGFDWFMEPADMGATIIEINRGETCLTTISDYTIKGDAGKILPKIVDEVERLLKEE